ncbi:acyl carrier protein familyprotein [Desulfovibrio sp. X2]|uniref:acyl carrier protein n=1 Tax=Desulfovibrio sp. X2 TaxID=941449 RepID=UPI000358C4DB|nr:acyl carrier protein [Desulfovibrio sp. X2]EPR37690.1 acyl carrier protein familyprotein [Desulfovibrio sp. X2]
MDVSTEILRELLVEAGVDQATAEAVEPSAPLLRQGVDSLDYPAFTLAVEGRFGIAVDERASFSLRTLDDFAAYIRGQLDAAAAPEAAPDAEKAAAIASLKAAWRDVAPGLKYRIGLLEPGDGQGVAQLFHTIYGDRYPVADYYVPEAIERLNAEGRLLTVVARLESGAIAGQGAYYQSSPPNKALFEYGQMLIAPEYRGTRMALEITRELDRLAHTMPQAKGFFGEAVCNHLTTQKLGVRRGYSECGLEISLMPAGAYENEGAGAQRVSCLISTLVVRDRRRELHLPERYRAPLETILSGFSLDRELRFSDMDAPAAAKSTLDSRVFDDAGVMRVQALHVGADFAERAEAIDAEARRHGLALAQVFINAGEPGAVFAAETLRGRGFVLGGLLPLWFGPDGLFMQKFYVEPEFDGILLYADKAKDLLAGIRAEWDEVKAEGLADVRARG